jgi:hypothetical protein
LSILVFSSWVWPKMKKVAEDDLAKNGGLRLGQLSPRSAITGEVREKKEKKKKKPRTWCFVLILICIFLLEMLRCQLMSERQKPPPFCTEPYSNCTLSSSLLYIFFLYFRLF